MRERAQERLSELKQEYVTGEAQLRELVQQEMSLRETLLRISGAIQVLEEILDAHRSEEPAPAGNGARPEVLTVP
jgi:prefoldin subunit 5